MAVIPRNYSKDVRGRLDIARTTDGDRRVDLIPATVSHRMNICPVGSVFVGAGLNASATGVRNSAPDRRENGKTAIQFKSIFV